MRESGLALNQACRTMEAFPDHVMEKFWAQDILRQHDEGISEQNNVPSSEIHARWMTTAVFCMYVLAASKASWLWKRMRS